MQNPIHLRVFLASPGDVAGERALALQVLEQLPYDPLLRGRLTLEAVAWDKPGAGTPMLATMTPQAAIAAGLPKPSECDIVVVIVWSRMGTPLPADEYEKPDGGAYLSGTEWEYLDALKGAKRDGGPLVLVYRRTEKVSVDLDDPQFDEKRSQYSKVAAFFAGFKNPDGSIRAGYNEYATPEDFREKLDLHLRDIIQRILKNPRSTVVPAQAPAPPPVLWQGSPFPGLRAFAPDDAPIFFGRGRETDELVQKLREPSCRFIAVVGASGSGKSSLVGAGLTPRLKNNAVEGAKDWLLPWVLPGATGQRKQWTGLRFTPGEMGVNPFLSLAGRLAPLLPDESLNPGKLAHRLEAQPETFAQFMGLALQAYPAWAEALVFIDQFEELFTVVEEHYRMPFIRLLAEATKTNMERRHPVGIAGEDAGAPTRNRSGEGSEGEGTKVGRVRLLLTLRADFYHRCVEIPELAELLRAGSFPLAAPRIGALHQMLAGPATRAGLEFEDGLPERILDETGEDAGSLALLAFALHELYEARTEGGLLSHAAYEKTGGARAAIARRAENTFNELPSGSQDRLVAVFRELVDTDERGSATRRRVAYDELAMDAEAALLVDAFTEARLLVADRTAQGRAVVEVAHEALLREWPRLKEWIEGRAEDLRVRRHAENSAAEWQRAGSKPSQLWHHEILSPVYEALERLGMDRTKLAEPLKSFLRPEAERLLEELDKPETTHYRRAEIGDRLDAIGDPRPGVGLRPDGIPDIVWCPVPPGEIQLENVEGTFNVEPCYIAKYPVTYRQYLPFLEEPTDYGNPDLGKHSQFSNQYRAIGNCPAENVDWFEALEYCRWLSAKLGYEVRLPTELEWQQAATGGNPQNQFPWGPENDSNKANTVESGLGHTTAVGMYPHGASPSGVLDMAGNVLEWCHEYRDPARINLGSNNRGVVRGGSWYLIRLSARCASRSTCGPGPRYNYLGFRVLCVSPIL